MSNPMWPQAARLFEAVLEMDEPERSAFLDQECRQDTELRSAVENLLANDQASLIETDGLHVRVSRSLDHQSIQSKIGSYQVVEQLGAGGMGIVYRAERADAEFEQTVAIKVLQRGLDPARFRVERQILARLDHPNIARLLDGGTLEDGRPFVAMEFVQGQSINEYCDQGRLSIDDRLRLFVQLCDAVQHAHGNLVVHRDLKPNNVLVDGNGSLKLLDFGIAKLLGEGADAGAKTQTAARMMTPGYASPEQIQGQPVTTASDVYSLGVMLFELLSGHRPFGRYESTPRDFEEAVANRAPLTPSRTVLNNALAEEDPGTARRVTSERLAGLLKGDLDNIVLKSLHTNPGKRYQSPRELAEDLVRHLEGHPVLARSAGAYYRLGKFVGRHRIGLAVAMVFLATAGLQQHRILVERDVTAAQRDLAQQQRDVAQRERDTAREIRDFMVGLFEISDPGEARGNSITAREMLDRGANSVSGRLGDQPIVQAELMATISSVYHKLGLLDQATPLIEQALILRQDTFGERSVQSAQTMVQLATLLQDTADTRSIEFAREALSIFQEVYPEPHEDTARALHLLAIALRYDGDLDAAEPLAREGLSMQRVLLGSESNEVAIGLNNLAGILKDQGLIDESISAYREALAIDRSVLGNDHPETVKFMSNLALALSIRGDLEEAAPLYRESLEVQLRILGERHPDVTDTMDSLAGLLEELGNYEEAEALVRDALEVRRKVLGENHPRVAASYTNLGSLLRTMGDIAGSDIAYLIALEKWELLSAGKDSWPVGLVLRHLAQNKFVQGDFRGGEAYAHRAVRVIERTQGEKHNRTAYAYYILAGVLAGLEKFDEAEPLAVKAYEVYAANNHPHASTTLDAVIKLYESWGKAEMAAGYVRLRVQPAK